jgi:hypothetical protein
MATTNVAPGEFRESGRSVRRRRARRQRAPHAEQPPLATAGHRVRASAQPPSKPVASSASEPAGVGSEHHHSLATRHNLAVAYQAAGRVAEAIAILQPLLAERERILGAEHPSTLTTRDSLAGAYSAAGRDAEAAAVEAGRGEGDAR